MPFIQPSKIRSLIATSTDSLLENYATLIDELVQDSNEEDKKANLAHASSTATVAKIRNHFISLYKLIDDLRSMQGEARAVDILEKEVKDARRILGVVKAQVAEGREVLNTVKTTEDSSDTTDSSSNSSNNNKRKR